MSPKPRDRGRALPRAPHDSGALRALSAEGVALWLDGVSRRHLLDGTLRAWVRGGLVSGAVLSLAAMTDELRRAGTSYQPQVDALARAGWRPERIGRELLRTDARWACRVLAPVHARAGGLDGWVRTDGADGSVSEALGLAADVGRRNLLVDVAATRSGLDVLRVCAREGVGTSATRVCSEERFAEVLDAHLSGLEDAVREGRDPARSVCVPCVAVGEVDAAVDDALARAAERHPVPGLAGLALARAVHGHLDRRLGGERWRALRSAGALPHRIAWHTSTPAQVREIVGWRTAHVVSAETAVGTALGPVPLGDSLASRTPDVRRDLNALRRHGVHLGCLAETLTRHAQRAHDRERAAFLAAVRDRMPRRQARPSVTPRR
ncbi:transaldolase family protein [Streptomyces sp. NPDC007903]|uniref:transaldolase family protein n=1 Tax=Streptomyces sp. NPDC007903 TaxID=3364786 RepID=UPI0036EDE34A